MKLAFGCDARASERRKFAVDSPVIIEQVNCIKMKGKKTKKKKKIAVKVLK